MRVRDRCEFFLLYCVLLMPGLSAATVNTVNLPGLVENSDRVFYGVCLSVESSAESRTGLPISIYEFRVIEALKGVESDQLIKFRQLDSSRGFGVAGLPSYRKGQKVLLFLHADSRLGLTSPVGMSQGVFRPDVGQDGELLLSNGVGNWNLSQGLDAPTGLAIGLSRSDYELLNSRQPISLSSLRSLVSRIDGYLSNRREEIE